MTSKLFGYEIRDADNRLVSSVGGFDKTTAETIAQRKRDEIRNRGWAMRVYVTEEHTISSPGIQKDGE